MVANVETTILVDPKTQVGNYTKMGCKGQRKRTGLGGFFARFPGGFWGLYGLPKTTSSG
jgi:hypothetical protein